MMNPIVASASPPKGYGTLLTNGAEIDQGTFSPAGNKLVLAGSSESFSPAQVQTLVGIINNGDAFAAASSGVIASSQIPSFDLFPQNYNLFLTPKGFGDILLGINLSSDNDPNLVGYMFAAVAMVPEPTSLGVCALGALGLLRRRRARR